MVAARRSGMEAVCAGQLGTGPDADRLRRAMAEEKFEVLLPPYPGLDSGHSVVLVTDDGERSFVSWPGAQARAADLGSLLQALRSAD
jgi:sugar/nucleoside kinase (ribokinase family)